VVTGPTEEQLRQLDVLFARAHAALIAYATQELEGFFPAKGRAGRRFAASILARFLPPQAWPPSKPASGEGGKAEIDPAAVPA
jgi:hypothetical protein